MSAKTTGWLAGLAISLFAFIFFYERHLPEAGHRSGPGVSLLPGFSPASVASVEIVRSNRLVLRAERTAGAWHLTAPIRQPAHQTAINNLLATVALLKRELVLSPEELLARPRAPAEFGLSPAQAKVILHQQGVRREFLLGTKTIVGRQIHFQLVGTPELFLAEAAFLDRLPVSEREWRDPTFLDLKSLTFNRVKIAAAQSFELRRDSVNQLWQMIDPVQARADNPRIDGLLAQLQNAPVRQFVADAPVPDLEVYGLQVPEVVLSFSQETNKVLDVHFGKTPPNDAALVYARRSDRSNVVLVAKEIVDPLRLAYKEYRDRQLVPVPPGELDVIEVRGEESFTLEKQTNQAWRVIDPAPFATDPGSMREFLNGIVDVKISDFVKEVVTDFSSYGLAAPARQYFFKARRPAGAGVTNLTLAQLAFGTNQGDMVFVRRGDENSVYAVNHSASLSWPSASFQLRDRRIWNLPATNISSLVITRKGQTRKIIRAAGGEWAFPPPFQGAINTFAVQDTVEELCQLRAERWVAQGDAQMAAFGFPAALQVALEVRFGDRLEPWSVELGGWGLSNRPFASVVLGGQRLIFEMSGSLYEKVVLYLASPAALNAPP